MNIAVELTFAAPHTPLGNSGISGKISSKKKKILMYDLIENTLLVYHKNALDVMLTYVNLIYHVVSIA